jgi:phosphatidylinositol alpha-1,6-mannosyltransferase
VRLLFLAADFPPAFGGIQKLSYGLCRALATEGHDVRVIASAQAGDDVVDSASGIPTLRCRAPNRFLAALNMGRGIRSVLQAGFAPHAIVATKWSPEAQAYHLSGPGRRHPLVLMGYGREFLPERGRPLRAAVQRAAIRAAAGAVVCSSFTATQMIAAGMPEGRVRVVHPGVDPTEFAPPTDLDAARRRLDWPSGPTLLTVARLVRRKGVDTVIQALPRITAAGLDVHYLVVGNGSDRDRLLALARAEGVPDRVRLLGSVADADKIACLHLCDVMAMPSRDLPSEPPEGFGIAYLEANLCGKPVIAANSGGVSEAVEDGLNGLLIEPDSPAQVAAAAIRLLGDPALAGSLGEAGRRRAIERFAWPVIAPRFAQAVAELTQA